MAVAQKQFLINHHSIIGGKSSQDFVGRFALHPLGEDF